MRCSLIALALTALSAIFAHAQVDSQPAVEEEALQSYTVTLVEFHTKSPSDPSLSLARLAEDFDKLNTDGTVRWSETVRMAVLAKHQTSVMFGRSVAMTMGVTQSQFGKTRNMKQTQLGTGVKVMAEPKGDKVLLKLDYQASRIAGEVNEDITPDIETVTIDATLLLNLGVRVIVAGDSSKDSNFLMVSVSQ